MLAQNRKNRWKPLCLFRGKARMGEVARYGKRDMVSQ